MKTIFYAIVKAITETITGLDGNALKLWDFEEYITVSNKVELLVNLVVLTAILCIGYTLVDFIAMVIMSIRTRKTLSN